MHVMHLIGYKCGKLRIFESIKQIYFDVNYLVVKLVGQHNVGNSLEKLNWI